MKKLLLLLALPVFISSNVHAYGFGILPSSAHIIRNLKVGTGVATGLISAFSTGLCYSAFTKPAGGGVMAAQGAAIVGLMAGAMATTTGIATAVLLNPTDYSSSTMAKLGVAAYSGALTAIFAGSAVKTAIKAKQTQNYPDKSLAKLFATLAVPTAVITAGALYCALDKNWQLKA